MFGIKTYIIKGINKRHLLNVNPRSFPTNSIPSHKVKNYIGYIKSISWKKSEQKNIGWLHTTPHPLAIDAYKTFLESNPNHLGNWTISDSQEWGTRYLESQVIFKMIDLYRGNPKKLEGYVTSGGTEGNLFTAWIGREFLKKFHPCNKICLIRTSLTHYSISKAANIISLDQYITPLDSIKWNMHPFGLYLTIKKLYKKGYRGFILPLTIGYTISGTHDDIQIINNLVKKTERDFKGVKLFVWIDAALDGLIEPFINNKFSPFSYPFVQALIVDYHKFGQVPFPAGIILYKKRLRKLIEQPIDYLPMSDSTLLGSRTGIPAASIWSVMHVMGRNGYKKEIASCMKNKHLFMNGVKSVDPEAKIITDANSLTCGVIFDRIDLSKLSKGVKDKFGLFAKKTSIRFYPSLTKKLTIFKFYFLPHVKPVSVNSLLGHIKTLI